MYLFSVWLCQVFVAVHVLSLVAASEGLWGLPSSRSTWALFEVPCLVVEHGL